MPAAPNLRSLEGALRATAVELAELASIADHLEFAHTAYGRKLDDAMISRLQLADLLTQRLAGLTAFVAALAEDAPGGVALDVGAAIAGLTLADQVARLSGAAPAPPVAPPPPSGELLLFGE
jgi:hypothetical protein